MSFNPTQIELSQKNQIYDSTGSPIWKIIYECVHGGREFANLGGKEVLDEIASGAEVNQGSSVVEFCSGSGATVEYMATSYGCKVTGLEINPHQFELARKRIMAAGISPGRVEFVLGDLTEWIPTDQFDLGYAMDSLMLVANLDRALGNAYHALKPGGTLAFAEITAGPFIDEAARRYAWEEDGMLNLLTVAEYSTLLRNAGFGDIHVRDLSGFAEQRAAAIHFAIRDHAEQLAGLVAPRALAGWLQSTEIYWKWFAQGKYGYALVAAKKP
jgi:SAM-dependent methyltransferase